MKFYFVFDFEWLYDVGVFADGIAGISLPAISMKPSSRKQVCFCFPVLILLFSILSILMLAHIHYLHLWFFLC